MIVFRRLAPFLLLAALTLSAFVPPAAAHGAPPEAAYETRVLHDHNDDSAVLLQGKHGFDAIALDVREAYLPGAGDALVIKLVLNGGCKPSEPQEPDPDDPFGSIGYDPVAAQEECGTITETVEFMAGEANHSLVFSTSDGGGNWTGDAAVFAGPFDINDGTRFAIEGWFPMAANNLSVGMELTDWFVRGAWGEEETDHMPAGFTNERGTDDATGPAGTAFDLGTYTIKAPDYYASLEIVDAGNGISLDDETPSQDLMLRITNLQPVAQEFTILASGPAGVDVRIDAAGGVVAIPDNGTLELKATVDASAIDEDLLGEVTFAILSHLGGFSTVALSLDVDMPDKTHMIVSEDLGLGGTFMHTFTEVGTFSYHSHHNPRVTGKVVVHAQDDGDEGIGAHDHEVLYVKSDGELGASFDPETLSIHVGDTVTWVNEHDETLMVMGAMGGMMDHDGMDPGDMDHDDMDHRDDHHDHHDGEDAPGIPIVIGLLAVLGLAMLRRR